MSGKGNFGIEKIDIDLEKWDFYNAVHRSDMTKLAIQNNESSFTRRNVNKYLLATTQPSKKSVLEQLLAAPKKSLKGGEYPPPFDELVRLQRPNGRWDNLQDVLIALSMPLWVRISIAGAEPSEWEQATSIAISFMRQHFYMFNLLANAHDRGSSWFTSNEILYEAREVVNKYYEMADLLGEVAPVTNRGSDKVTTGCNSNRNGSNSNDKEEHMSVLSDDNCGVDSAFHAVAFSLPQKRIVKIAILGAGTAFVEDRPLIATIVQQQQQSPLNAQQLSAPETEVVFVEEVQVEPPPAQPDTQTSTNSADEDYEADIADGNGVQGGGGGGGSVSSLQEEERWCLLHESEQRVQTMGVDIVQACLDLEAHLADIKRCKDRSVAFFNSCDTHAERYLAFDELTTMLGEGALPREGFKDDDWRSKGCKGYRTLAVRFFNKISYLAEERLVAEELRKVKRPLIPEYVCDGNRGRWGFVWEGEDLVTKVLHSLDFLRKVREFANWYGKNFSFLGNPLMLPFDMRYALEELEGMDERCSQLLESQAFLRRGVGAVDGTKHWRHKKYLGTWYRAFFSLCEAKMQWNWPKLEEVKLLEEYAPIYNAMSVIYIRNLPSVNEAAAYEKKFISLAITSRGKHLMQGSSGLKPDRPLALPPRYRMPADDEVDMDALIEQFKQKPSPNASELSPSSKPSSAPARAKTPIPVATATGAVTTTATGTSDTAALIGKDEGLVDIRALVFNGQPKNRSKVQGRVRKALAKGDDVKNVPAAAIYSLKSKVQSAAGVTAPPAPLGAEVQRPPSAASLPGHSEGKGSPVKRSRSSIMMRKALNGQAPSKSVLALQADAEGARVSRVSVGGSAPKMTRKTVLAAPPRMTPAANQPIRLGHAPPSVPPISFATPVLLAPIKKKL